MWALNVNEGTDLPHRNGWPPAVSFPMCKEAFRQRYATLGQRMKDKVDIDSLGYYFPGDGEVKCAIGDKTINLDGSDNIEIANRFLQNPCIRLKFSGHQTEIHNIKYSFSAIGLLYPSEDHSVNNLLWKFL
jgi:hypothetical protein